MAKLVELGNVVVSVDHDPVGAYRVVSYRNNKNGRVKIYIYDKKYLDRKVVVYLQKIKL